METLLLDSVGRKLQNNTMTTSVRSRNSILPASVCSMRRVCGISRLQKSLSPCTGPTYKPCHIDLRSLAPPQAYLRECNHIYRSAARRNKCKGTPAEKDSHVMCLQPVARELRPQYNQLQTFFCNTSQGRLQECQGYGQPRPDQTLNQRRQFSGSLNATCVGPESRFPTQKLAETHTQTLEILEIKQSIGS